MKSETGYAINRHMETREMLRMQDHYDAKQEVLGALK
jgi:hypothetical protein